MLSGARSGALIAGASLVATALNYGFLLAAGRLLGSDDFGALAALLALLTAVLLPTGALQLAVSREVSRLRAVGAAEQADAFARTMLRLGTLVSAPVVLAGLALAVPLQHLLNIDSAAPVVLTMGALAIALAMPVVLGVLQGYERFTAVGVLSALPFALRLALLGLAAAAGYRLGGAVLAAVVGSFATAVLALALIREPLRRGAAAAAPSVRPFLRYLWPVVVGLIGIAVLTTVDLLVVKARFSDEAGGYAAASAFARVAFFLPATILTVLFPRTAARQARGEDTADILGRSLVVTAVFGAGLALFYAMTGRGLVHTSFGSDFAEGGELLAALTVSMTLFAIANVFVGFHLSRGETRYAWVVASCVPVQIALLALLPQSVRGVIWTDIGIGIALLTAHELLVGSSLPALRTGLGLLAGEFRLARRTIIEGLVVVLAASVVVCLLFWPLVTAFGSSLAGEGSDATGGIWWLWQLHQESGYHLFGTTHHTLTGAPFGWEGDNGLNIQFVLPYYPAYLLAGVVGEVAAQNLVLLAGYVLSGASMYLLTRYLGCSRLVSAWAGMVFVIFPAHLERTPHPSLTHLEFIPLLLVALIAAAQRPTWARFLFVGLGTLACWLTSGYFGVMAVAAVAAFTVGAALTSIGRRRPLVLTGSIATAIAATLLVTFLSVISGVGRGSGLQRVAVDLEVYGVRALELVVPAARNIILGDWLEPFWDGRQHASNFTETSNYLGLLTIGLALAWLVVSWRHRAALPERLRIATPGLVAVLLAALAFSLPSPVSVLGVELWMPSRLVWEVVPPFRVPSRWVVLVMAALVPLAALALQSASARLAARGASRRGVALAPVAVVAAAMLFSFLELAIPPAHFRIQTDEAPAEYAALARTPDGVLVDYPLVEDIDRLVWQRLHRRPVLNSSAFGTPADDARRALLDPGAPGTAEALAFLGVTAIVTHPDAFDYAEDVPDVPNASWGAGYDLVTRTPDGASVWRVVAPAAPALATLAAGFGEPGPPRDGLVTFPLDSSSGVGYLELRAKAPALVSLTFGAWPPAGERGRVLRLADAERELPFTVDGRTTVTLLVEVPRGLSRLTLKTDPAATSADDAIRLRAPRAALAFGEPELFAEPVSPDPGFLAARSGS